MFFLLKPGNQESDLKVLIMHSNVYTWRNLLDNVRQGKKHKCFQQAGGTSKVVSTEYLYRFIRR